MRLRISTTSPDYILQVRQALNGLNARYQQVDLDSHSANFQWLGWADQADQDLWVWSVIANRKNQSLLFLIQAIGAFLGTDDDLSLQIRRFNRQAGSDTGRFALLEPIRELTYIEGPVVAPDPLNVLENRLSAIEKVLGTVRNEVLQALYPPLA